MIPMKTALVTGGSAGIGKETVRKLVSFGYQVLIAARDEHKGQALVDSLKASQPAAAVRFLSVDLSDFDQVRKCCADIRAAYTHFDLLVLNAGLFTPRLRTNGSGYECMFATTHLGHFLLTHELMPLLALGSDRRIVVTSSVAHKLGGRIDFEALRQPSSSTALLLAPFRGYGRSKLANILFVRELARRYDPAYLKANAFHPGAIRSEIWRSTPSLFNRVVDPFLLSTEQGARTQIYLATSPELTRSGEYWVDLKPEPGNRASRDPELAAALWRYSEQALGIREFGSP